MNYQTIINNLLNEYKDPDFRVVNMQSLELTIKYFNSYFERSIKSYNDNIERGTDFFSAVKGLRLFNIFVNEHFPLLNDDNSVKKGMNQISEIIRHYIYEINENDPNSTCADVKLVWNRYEWDE